MPDLTINLGLKKPTDNETADIAVINENMDTIDLELTKKATQTQDGRMSKEDKVKLDGIETGANNYVHPSTHPATMIEEDSTHRFVTDTEKSIWNAKETPSGAQAKVDSHASATSVHGATSSASANRIILRDAYGRAKVAAPSASDDIARKAEVDAVQTDLNNHKGATGSAHGVATTSVAGFMTAADKQKLNGIESGAQVNPTASEIRDALKTVDGSGSGIDADLLDGWHRDSIRDWNNLLNKPLTFPPSNHTHTKAQITDFSHQHSVSDLTDYQGLQIAHGVVNGVNYGSLAPDSTMTISIDIGFNAKYGRALIFKGEVYAGQYASLDFTTDNTKTFMIHGAGDGDTSAEDELNNSYPSRVQYIFNGESYIRLNNVYIEGRYLKIVVENINISTAYDVVINNLSWIAIG